MQDNDKRLSEFTHLCDKIRLFWGQPEFFAFVEELLFDTRGSRQGFPTATMIELNMLYEIHLELVPYPDKKRDIWTDRY